MKKITLFLMTMLFSLNANAYLDPASFSAIISGLIGAIAASFIYLKNFWLKIINLVKKIFMK